MPLTKDRTSPRCTDTAPPQRRRERLEGRQSGRPLPLRRTSAPRCDRAGRRADRADRGGPRVARSSLPAAIVTGASSGIGRAIAEKLGGAGAHVHPAGRTVAAMEESRARIERTGGRAAVIELDVRDVRQVQELAKLRNPRPSAASCGACAISATRPIDPPCRPTRERPVSNARRTVSQPREV